LARSRRKKDTDDSCNRALEDIAEYLGLGTKEYCEKLSENPKEVAKLMRGVVENSARKNF
jgi:hypothetical protein